MRVFEDGHFERAEEHFSNVQLNFDRIGSGI
jgi:hypothetical protein